MEYLNCQEAAKLLFEHRLNKLSLSELPNQLIPTSYEEAYLIIKNKYSISEAIKITVNKTMNFAKRQRTWFRNKNNPFWLDNKNPLKDAIIRIESSIS